MAIGRCGIEWRFCGMVIAAFVATVTGCAPRQAITVTNQTDGRVHVEARQAFVGKSLLQNPQRFRFELRAGQAWQSDEAGEGDRVSIGNDEAASGLMLVRAREPDAMAPWAEARFDAVEHLRVLVQRDAAGGLRVVGEVLPEAQEKP